jgi:hypothetical protein
MSPEGGTPLVGVDIDICHGRLNQGMNLRKKHAGLPVVLQILENARTSGGFCPLLECISQDIELLGERWCRIIGVTGLPLMHHVNHLDTR